MLSRLGVDGRVTKNFLFTLGKYGDYISYDKEKVLIGVNVHKPGYYKVEKVVESSSSEMRVTVSEEQLYDYYSGITYNDFLLLIRKMNYKIAYELSYTNPNLSLDGTCEKNFMAYNKTLNTLIMAETGDQYTENEFSSVRCRVYGVNISKLRDMYPCLHGMCISGTQFIEFDLENCKPKIKDGLHIIECVANRDYRCQNLSVPYIGGLWRSNDGRNMSYTDLTKLFLSIIPNDFREWFSNN